ncbi:MAG: SDR family oxidoreductase [Nocardiaceae bacterium]|nr:SDR family oxidoreductase [Nocardiaceae bacterium]
MGLPAASSTNCAVVTGASSGIGLALARELASRGYALILVARRADLLEKIAGEITAAHGVTVEIRPTDLADRDQRGKLVDELFDREIAVLCNNAGIATFGALATLDPAAERAEVELNAVALHDLTLAVLPGMLERRAGGILMSGSAAGNMPIPNNATYAATKAFVNSFCESLRHELLDTGVHITLLAPGPVRGETPDAEAKSFVDKAIPDFLWVTTEYTARVSIDALDENKMRIVPGVLSKAMSVAGGYSPRAMVAPIVGKFYERLAT